MTQRIPLLLVLVLAAGCRDSAASSKSASPKACAAIVAQQKQRARALPSPCKTDAECGCYNGGTPVTHCGGYAARGLAAKLDALTRRYVEGRCSPALNCAPRLCNPGCVRGRCGERPRGSGGAATRR